MGRRIGGGVMLEGLVHVKPSHLSPHDTRSSLREEGGDWKNLYVYKVYAAEQVIYFAVCVGCEGYVECVECGMCGVRGVCGVC